MFLRNVSPPFSRLKIRCAEKQGIAGALPHTDYVRFYPR
jgi:hypothetical protein